MQFRERQGRTAAALLALSCLVADENMWYIWKLQKVSYKQEAQPCSTTCNWVTRKEAHWAQRGKAASSQGIDTKSREKYSKENGWGRGVQ